MLVARYIDSSLIVAKFDEKKITHAFHDIDGTHSLIRDWPPVMSIVLNDVIENGLKNGYDSDENVNRLVDNAGKIALPETDRFCIESAGLSALTQMEWAIRRAVEQKKISVKTDHAINSEKIHLIWQGKEELDYLEETDEMKEMLRLNTPRLFKFYEKVLNGFCRDKNLEKAKSDPNSFQIAGSMRFLQYLKDNDVKNYFVTGAVVERGMGMFEEVEVLGYGIGQDKLVEDIIGSTWTDKLPKNVIMNKLIKDLKITAEQVMVVGDGRAEIEASATMGCLTISRLPKDAHYQMELHKRLGTDIITEDFNHEDLYKILAPV